jgi:hypothetical protein
MADENSIGASVGRGGANLPDDVRIVQTLLNVRLTTSASPLVVDGVCSPPTISAIESVQSSFLHFQNPDGRVDPDGATLRFLAGPANETPASPAPGAIAWGKKVSPEFKAKVIEICANLAMDPNFLMSAMAFESGESFSPSVKNPVSSATGLIQFMAATAIGLGTTTAALAAMTAVDQLDFVEKYFNPFNGRLKTIEDTYMAILFPAAIGKDNTFVLFSKPSKAYAQNAGLDADKDGNVTKAEAAAMVKAKSFTPRSRTQPDTVRM